MAAFLPAIIGGGLSAIIGGLKQHSANNQQGRDDVEATRQAQQDYNMKKARYDAQVASRKNSINMARAISKAHGYNIPDSVFDMMLAAPVADYPAFSAPTPGYKPSAWLGAAAGAGSGALDAVRPGGVKAKSGLAMPSTSVTNPPLFPGGGGGGYSECPDGSQQC